MFMFFYSGHLVCQYCVQGRGNWLLVCFVSHGFIPCCKVPADVGASGQLSTPYMVKERRPEAVSTCSSSLTR